METAVTGWAALAGLALGMAAAVDVPGRILVARRVRSLVPPGVPTAGLPTVAGSLRRRGGAAWPGGVLAALLWAGSDGGGGPSAVEHGLLAGLTVVVLLRLRVAAAVERAKAERRAELVRQLPVAVDLVAACLAAGGTVPSAVAAVSHAMPGPVDDVLGPVVGALSLGADPVVAWQELCDDPVLAPLGRVLVRAADGGVPASALLGRVADDLRSRAGAEARRRAEAVGVRALLPLGLCFLPAFVLLGVVPTVAGLVAGVL